MIPTFSHSGNLGDLIWSLPTVVYHGPGELHIILGGVPAAIRKYNNGPVFPEYEGRLSQKDYDLVAPLLKAQPYILKVTPYDGSEKIEYDLDEFRGTVGQAFKANFIETFAQTFHHPASYEPWLFVEPKKIANFVVTRTTRYHSNRTTTIPTWIRYIKEYDLGKEGVFIGLPDEHQGFQDLFNVEIPYYKCEDFLDMAQVIAGCDTFLSNQTFAYSLAQGLGKRTILEYRSIDCHMPRTDCHYF